MNWLLSEVIMNSGVKVSTETDSNPYLRKLKRSHKLGQYSKVHKFACVYLEIKTQSIVQRCTIS